MHSTYRRQFKDIEDSNIPSSASLIHSAEAKARGVTAAAIDLSVLFSLPAATELEQIRSNSLTHTHSCSNCDNRTVREWLALERTCAI